MTSTFFWTRYRQNLHLWRHFGDKENVFNSSLYPVIYQNKNGWPAIKQTSQLSFFI